MKYERSLIYMLTFFYSNISFQDNSISLRRRYCQMSSL